jgi:hypothetical protein
MSQVFNKDLEKIKHDIRNFKNLTVEQLKYIFSLPEKDKNDIILLYNKIHQFVNEIFEFNKK